MQMLSRLINRTLDWIYPPRCVVCSGLLPINGNRWICAEGCKELIAYAVPPLCPRCGAPVGEGSACPECEGKSFRLERNSSAIVYDDVAKTMIYRFKYGGRAEYGEGFAHLMLDWFGKGFFTGMDPDILIPVPLHISKEKRRGYNQSALMARSLGRMLRLPVNEGALVRLRATKAQSGLTPYERRRNIDGAFGVSGGFDPKGKRILLIDDIFTTGSTLEACARLLTERGAKSVRSVTAARAV